MVFRGRFFDRHTFVKLLKSPFRVLPPHLLTMRVGTAFFACVLALAFAVFKNYHFLSIG
jgi:hypothetical protein